MSRNSLIALGLVISATGALLLLVPEGKAQRDVVIMAPDEAREQLDQASLASEEAEARVQRFTREAQEAEEAADKAASEAAALAAEIQRSEAQISAARARYSLTQVERARLANRLANRQEPLVRLTAALQTAARRPLALSALQPGSLQDLVYVRAVLDSAVPQIQERTQALKSELEQGRTLERRARRTLIELGQREEELEEQRNQLAAYEARQRVTSQSARDNALREAERALALAEEVRDLDGLIERLDANAALRQKLAALPGPVLRPASMSDTAIAETQTPESDAPVPAPTQASAPADFQLPVQGRTITGFGEQRASGLRSKGIVLGPQPGAQIVAPAGGRIAFSGPYEGFGRIVIIEHDGGWTSLVTGLARIDVAVGEMVIAGAPLGVANGEGGAIGIELRDQGEPVNPLNYLR
ncbi:MAG: peptidoglycan DD-metalloendopeptidase family protein [Pseudomonadota bacterium]